MNNHKKIWLVTGASKGLGLSLVEHLLKGGYRVAATTRDKGRLVKSLESLDTRNLLPLEVDLTDDSKITAAVSEVIAKFGGLDVLVNNAGYGIAGALEEFEEKEIRKNFDINVFAVVKMMQAVMPHFREKGAGHIINIASIAGFMVPSGWAMYAAAKAAVIALSEVTAQDVGELGIKVTVVAPGGFRTDFLNESSLAYSSRQIADYTELRESLNKYAALDGKQIGNPEKYAEVMIALAENPSPPAYLFLGSDAYGRAQKKIDALTKNLENNKSITLSTDYED